MMKQKEKVPQQTNPRQQTYRCLEDVIGCKWSVSVLVAVDEGVVRPGAMQRHIPAISTKVLNERLRKLTRYGLLSQTRYAESPPRTEYGLTAFGHEVIDLIAKIKMLDMKR